MNAEELLASGTTLSTLIPLSTIKAASQLDFDELSKMKWSRSQVMLLISW